MADVRADGIAVYVYRPTPAGIELLQIHRSARTGEYQQSWQIVYGGIEPGETAPQAARRELQEETGLVPRGMFQVEYLEQFYFMPHDYVLIMPVFAAEVAPDATVTLNDEHDAHRWVKAAAVEAHFMWRTQREAIAILLEELARPTASRPLLTINLRGRT
jgi:dATP pyrophosphohydrolase